jgi:hypothetical protein
MKYDMVYKFILIHHILQEKNSAQTVEKSFVL